MINIYSFANILKHSRNIDYNITRGEAEMVKIFSLKPWIQLVNKYVKIEYDRYGIKHMLGEYSKGNITLDVNYIDKVITYDEFEIYSDVCFLKKFHEQNPKDFSHINSRHINLSDSVYLRFMPEDKNMYIDSSTWFVMKNDRIIQRLTMLQSKESAYRMESLNPVLKEDFLYNCLIITKFILENFGYKTTYRVLKKDKLINSLIPQTNDIDISFCLGKNFEIPQKSLNLARYEDKGDYYIQYYDQDVIKKITIDDIKEIYKCQ